MTTGPFIWISSAGSVHFGAPTESYRLCKRAMTLTVRSTLRIFAQLSRRGVVASVADWWITNIELGEAFC